MESVLNRVNGYRSGIHFLKDMEMKTGERRKEFERRLSKVEAATNKNERGLNKKNDKFDETNEQLKDKHEKISVLTAEIKSKKDEKKKLVQYVIDGEQRYKYEVNKIWFFTVFNIGGIAAVLYMTL
jgi:septal ring factor EnvC (AmiA/AmiB activator)